MLKMTIKVDGMKKTKSRMRELDAILTSMPRAWKDIGKEVGEYYASTGFASQGGVFGSVWPSLSGAYQAQKLKEFGAKPMLIATGAMQRSFVAKSNGTGAIIYNEMEYWKYHQSKKDRSKIPRRPTAGINSKVTSIVRKHIQQEINRALR